MFNKKEYDKNYRETHREQNKNKKCPDCGKKIWSESIRCKSCARKEQYKLHPETHPQLGKSGDLSPAFKGGWKHFCIDCGVKVDFEAIRCKHHARIEQYKNPSNHPQWLGGISFEPYTIEFNDSLKEIIRSRDNHICQNCGMTEEEHLIVIGKVLTIHHIDYNKENCNHNNLITLCGSCNTRANYNREYWTEFYQQKVSIV